MIRRALSYVVTLVRVWWPRRYPEVVETPQISPPDAISVMMTELAESIFYRCSHPFLHVAYNGVGAEVFASLRCDACGETRWVKALTRDEREGHQAVDVPADAFGPRPTFHTLPPGRQ